MWQSHSTNKSLSRWFKITRNFRQKVWDPNHETYPEFSKIPTIKKCLTSIIFPGFLAFDIFRGKISKPQDFGCGILIQKISSKGSSVNKLYFRSNLTAEIKNLRQSSSIDYHRLKNQLFFYDVCCAYGKKDGGRPEIRDGDRE